MGHRRRSGLGPLAYDERGASVVTRPRLDAAARAAKAGKVLDFGFRAVGLGVPGLGRSYLHPATDDGVGHRCWKSSSLEEV